MKAAYCIAILTGMFSYSLAAQDAAPTSRPTETSAITLRKATPEQIHKAIRQLGADDPYDVEAARIILSCEPPSEFPSIVDASKDKSLSPKASRNLTAFIELQGPWQNARQRNIQSRNDYQKWVADLAVRGYDESRKKDPKWDDLAHKALRTYFTLGHRSSVSRAAMKAAIDAGCDNPLILYYDARSSEGVLSAEATFEKIDKAAKAFIDQGYPPYTEILCNLRALTQLRPLAFSRVPRGKSISFEDWKEMNDLLNRATGLWQRFIDAHPIEPAVQEASLLLIDASDGLAPFLKPAFDKTFRATEKGFPESSVTYLVKGKFYVKYAWEARGGGWANTVTDDGWKKFGERLDQAEEALTKAWEKDPNNSEAATEMLTVELGQGKGRDRMELWFSRAMAADPDNLRACQAKMYYLEPKWHGSPEDMFKFAQECYDTHNWNADVPIEQIDAINRLAAYTDAAKLYHMPGAWLTIESVYEPLLRVIPNDITRSKYCHSACLCDRWDIAKRQFDLLGKRAAPSAFGGVAKMNQFRDTAMERGKTADNP